MTTDASSPQLSPEERATLRAAVASKVEPLAGRKEYAVTDAKTLDPMIDAALQTTTGGRAPSSEKERAAVIAHAESSLYHALSTTEGLAWQAELVRRRYENPVVARQGDEVTIDVGIPPGQLSVVRGKVFLWKSPVVKDFQWSTEEAARHLALAMKQHPDAKTYKAQVTIPTRDGVNVWTYVYDRADDRVRVYVPSWRDRIFSTDRVGGDLGPFLSGKKSLAYADLTLEWKAW